MVYDVVDLPEVSEGEQLGEVQCRLCTVKPWPAKVSHPTYMVHAFFNITSSDLHFLQCCGHYQSNLALADSGE